MGAARRTAWIPRRRVDGLLARAQADDVGRSLQAGSGPSTVEPNPRGCGGRIAAGIT